MIVKNKAGEILDDNMLKETVITNEQYYNVMGAIRNRLAKLMETESYHDANSIKNE